MRKMNRKFLFIAMLLMSLGSFLNSCKDKDEDGEKIVSPNATEFTESADGKTITVTDKGEGVGNYTFTADKTWVLNGLVYVNETQTLTIEAGTLVQGKPGTAENASALVVARGGKLNAVGTAEKPIVFTAEADNYEGTGVAKEVQGLWGGIIILGKATTNNSTSEKAIEGIPTNETRGLYGGTDDNDNSGTMKYVSIRHGGTDIGEGNEINGLTLGAVGKGTTLEYIEVISNKDDGIEFFGGCPQIKYALVSGCGDDSFDYDEGFHGKGQFWCTIQSADGDRMGEHDGGPSDNQTGMPYATPVILNATYFGNEAGKVITFRENAGGTYANSLFVNQDGGIDIEYLQDDAGAMVACTYKMFEDDYLNVQNNVFYNVKAITTEADDNGKSLFKISVPKDDAGKEKYPAPDEVKSAWAAAFAGNTNKVANPGISASNPVPASPQTSDLFQTTDSFFTPANYKGAFDGSNWAKGWSLLFQ